MNAHETLLQEFRQVGKCAAPEAIRHKLGIPERAIARSNDPYLGPSMSRSSMRTMLCPVKCLLSAVAMHSRFVAAPFRRHE